MKKILIVDDDKTILDILKELIELLGHQPIVCKHPEAALKYCLENKVDIVITDYSMPNTNGLEFAKKLTENIKDIKIFMLSGYSQHLTKEQLKESGIISIIDKPFRIDNIDEILNKG